MRTIAAYWTTTALVTAECAGGGLADLLHAPPFYPAMIQLGYPSYFATILGVAKLIAAVFVAAPGLPRLKEWAYAGILINMIGAIASQLATHGSAGTIVAPAGFAVLALLSWQWRPRSRRLDAPAAGRSSVTSRDG